MDKINAKIHRAKSERMYLIAVNADELKFTVEGSRGIEYNLKFGKVNSCDCPYFKFNNKICKHMYFIINRVCKLEPQKVDSTSTDIIKMYPTLIETLKKVHRPKEDTDCINQSYEDCCICYESMHESSVIKCGTCNQCIHNSCMTIWAKNTCPLCRSIMSINVPDCLSKLTFSS